MKLFTIILCTAIGATTLGVQAAPCTSAQLSAVNGLTSDPALLQACPTVTSTNFLTDVAPCADPNCVAFLSTQVSGKLPDCEVNDGATFKDLYAAFVSVCRENANGATNGATTAPPTTKPTNATTNMPSNATVITQMNMTLTLLPITRKPTQVPANATNTTSSSGSGSGSGRGNGTDSGTAVPTPDKEAVGGNTKPAVPKPAPASHAARLSSIGLGVSAVATTAMVVAVLA